MKLQRLMVRYIVNDVNIAADFYVRQPKFQVTAQSGADFAILERENLQLVLSPPMGPGGGSQPMPDGGRQILLEDPSNNLVELFEPATAA